MSMYYAPVLDWPYEGIVAQHESQTSGLSWGFQLALEWRDSAYTLLREFGDEARAHKCFDQREYDELLKGVRCVTQAYQNDAAVRPLRKHWDSEADFDYCVTVPVRDPSSKRVVKTRFGVIH